MNMTLQEKILRQKKIDYLNQEISNYKQAIKVGTNPSFTAYNVAKSSKLRLELESI
jgi:hypothetical protein